MISTARQTKQVDNASDRARSLTRSDSALQVEGGLYGAGQARQGEFVESADALTGPGSVKPGEVSDVGQP
jgi:hypothetical protein